MDVPEGDWTWTLILLKVTLSLTPLDSNHPGYFAPIPEDQIKEFPSNIDSEMKDGSGTEEG